MSKESGIPPWPRTPRLNAMLCSLPSSEYTQLWYMQAKFDVRPSRDRHSIAPRCAQRLTRTRMAPSSPRTMMTGVSPIHVVR